MGQSHVVPALALVAAGLPSMVAAAGVTGGTHTIEFMQIASGFVDLENPSSSTFTDFTTIHDPPVGSYLDIEGLIPGSRSFLGELDFTSCDGLVSRFDFRFGAQSGPFTATGLEFFFAGGRIDVTSSVDFSVNFAGLVGGSGGGIAFLYDYDDEAPHLFFPAAEPIDFTINLSAGTHRIAWGTLVDPTGGDSTADGSLTFTFIPAPGAAALLILAGVTASRRRVR